MPTMRKYLSGWISALAPNVMPSIYWENKAAKFRFFVMWRRIARKWQPPRQKFRTLGAAEARAGHRHHTMLTHEEAWSTQPIPFDKKDFATPAYSVYWYNNNTMSSVLNIYSNRSRLTTLLLDRQEYNRYNNIQLSIFLAIDVIRTTQIEMLKFYKYNLRRVKTLNALQQALLLVRK